MKYKINAVIIFVISLLVLVGCGEEETLTASGIIVKEGSIIEAHLVEDFDEAVYSVSELDNMIKNEVSEYNSTHAMSAVTAQPVTIENGAVHLVMTFATPDDYTEFNSRRLYIDSLEAALKDNKIGASMRNVKTGEKADLSAIENPEKYSLMITDEVGVVVCPGKIAFVSDGVEINDKKQLTVTDEMDGLAYIIFANK